MKLFFAVFTLIILSTSNIATASPAFGTISYEYNKQVGQTKQLTPDITVNLNYDLTNHLSFNSTFESNRTNNQPATNTVNNAYLEYKNTNSNYILGKQSYTLSNGLIASMSGINGINANFAAPDHTATIFYGKNSENLIAANLAFNKLGNLKKITLEANYFQDENRYIGITAFNKISNDILLTAETSENLNAMAFGYLITLEHGSTQKIGDTDISIAYRNIESEAVSKYCTDWKYDNSKGFRIELNDRIGKKIILTAYHDIAESRSKTNIDTTYIAISSNF